MTCRENNRDQARPDAPPARPPVLRGSVFPADPPWNPVPRRHFDATLVAGRYWPLEAALWDIIGQVAGQPVSVLFGGATRRLPAYASFGAALPPQDRAQAARAAKSAGFRAVKIRIDRTDPGTSLDAVRATRAAVGEEFVIMADLNQWWRMPPAPWASWPAPAPLVHPAHLDQRPGPPGQPARGGGVGGGPYVEFPYDPPGWTPERRAFFLTEPVRVDPDGYLTVPAAPGLGAEIDHAAVARYARPAQG